MIFSEAHGPGFDLIVCGTPGPKSADRFAAEPGDDYCTTWGCPKADGHKGACEPWQTTTATSRSMPTGGDQ